jgi:tetratricopeptide (TPR) repeat protein
MDEDLQHLAGRLRQDKTAREQLAALLAPELAAAQIGSAWERARPFLAGASSALVVLLAFLVPSLQEQWDRFRTRASIERYAAIGRTLMQQEHFASAEQAYGRALELAGMQREDLLEGQLRARVLRIYDTPEWRAKPDESVTEADFVYLLAAEGVSDHRQERASTLGAYGTYLAGLKRWVDAEANLKESVALDPSAATPHINLGNLYDDQGQGTQAEAEYRRAIELNPNEANAHYDLGLLLSETGRMPAAVEELSASVKLAPQDVLARVALAEVLEALKRYPESFAQTKAALKLAPGNDQAKALALRLAGEGRHKR